MRPESKKSQGGQFTPRWRHFHPQATLYVRNPFEKDVVFQVADEYNTPFQYRMKAGKISELPGGAVATLGLKALVDKMIGEEGRDALRIWDLKVRASYEKRIIVKEKQPPVRTSNAGVGGEVDLATSEEEMEQDDAATRVTTDETAFPSMSQPQQPARPTNNRKGKQRAASTDDDDLATVAARSLGTENQVVEED